MNTEKITNQLNKKMDELLQSDNNNYLESLKVGIELEMILDFKKFEQNNKSNKNNTNKGRDQSKQNIKDFQTNIYKKLKEGFHVKLNYIYNLHNNDDIDDYMNKDEMEEFNSKYRKYTIKFLKLIQSGNEQIFTEILKQILPKYLKKIFLGNNGFYFKYENKSLMLYYGDNLLINNSLSSVIEDGYPDTILLKRMIKKNESSKDFEIFSEDFESDFQSSLFGEYDGDYTSINEKIEIPPSGDYINNIYQDDYDNENFVFNYDDGIILNGIEFCGAKSSLVPFYERRVSLFYKNSLKILRDIQCNFDIYKYQDDLDRLDGNDSNQVGSFIFDLLVNNIDNLGSISYDNGQNFNFSVFNNNLLGFTQAFFESVQIDFFNVGKNSFYFKENSQSFFEFYRTKNRVIHFMYLMKYGLYKEQILVLQRYYELNKNDDKELLTLSELIQNEFGIKFSGLELDKKPIMDKIKGMRTTELTTFAQKLFNNKLEQEYDGYENIKNSSDVIFTNQYHHYLDENGINHEFNVNEKQKHLVYEYDNSIIPSNDKDRTKGTFEMVTPALPYGEQKKLLNYLIQNKDNYQIILNKTTGLHLNVSSFDFDYLNEEDNIDFVSLQYLIDELNIQINLRVPTLAKELSEYNMLGTKQNDKKIDLIKKIKTHFWLYLVNKGSKYKRTIDKNSTDKILKQLEDFDSKYLERIKTNLQEINKNDKISDVINETRNIVQELGKLSREKNTFRHSMKFKNYFIYKKISLMFKEVISDIINKMDDTEKSKIMKQISEIEKDQNEQKYLFYFTIMLLYFDFGLENEQSQYFGELIDKHIKQSIINEKYNKYFTGADKSNPLYFANLILPEYEQKLQEELETKNLDINEINFNDKYNELQEKMKVIIKEKIEQFTIKNNRIEFRIIGNDYLKKSVIGYFDRILKSFYQVTTDGVREELTDLTKEKIYNEIKDYKSSDNLNNLLGI